MKETLNYRLAYYAGNRSTGSVSIIQQEGGDRKVMPLPVAPESGLEKALKPVFVGLTEDLRFILLDPKSKEVRLEEAFPADAFPAHIYSDPRSRRDWFMNDGDKETGNDRLNCGDQGSSVTVVEETSSSRARWLGTICVGRGHHQAAFAFPSGDAPKVPETVYVSNLKDGTLSAIGNDPGRPDFLQVVATINLCEPEKEDGGAADAIPNNAFPHGLAYSSLSGRLYNLNNGYGTVAVIDPVDNRIERRFDFKGHSNLFVTPDGRYIIGRGADRKSDPDHVIARLTVYDVLEDEIGESLSLPDIYISKYYFNADGSKLYLTTGSSGSPEQQANLKDDALLIFDTTDLPRLRLVKELRLGASSGALAFLNEGGRTIRVFSSNSADGTLTVVDGDSDEIVESFPVTDGMPHSRIWLLP